jgi:hypothetical protein
MLNKPCGVTVLIFLLVAGFVFSEDAITEFDERLTLDIFANFNIGLFRVQEISRYKTDMPWAAGVGIRYRKMSVRIAVPVSFSNATFNLEVNSYYEKMFLEFFLRKYRYFYHEDDIEYTNAGLDIGAAGLSAGWIQNNKRHSLGSVFNLDRKQNTSNGSLLLGVGLYYTSLYSENKDMPRYHERQRLVYFGPSAGYSYTWVLPHDLFINTGITIGLNLGINTTANALLCIPQFRPKFCLGRHGGTWSVNIIAYNNITIIQWKPDTSDTFTPETVTLNFSKRF